MIKDMPERKPQTVNDALRKPPAIPTPHESTRESDRDSLYEDMSIPPEKRNRLKEQKSATVEG